MMCYEATRHAVWLQNFIHDLGVVESIERPIMMYCENTVAVSFSNNLKGILLVLKKCYFEPYLFKVLSTFCVLISVINTICTLRSLLFY